MMALQALLKELQKFFFSKLVPNVPAKLITVVIFPVQTVT